MEKVAYIMDATLPPVTNSCHCHLKFPRETALVMARFGESPNIYLERSSLLKAELAPKTDAAPLRVPPDTTRAMDEVGIGAFNVRVPPDTARAKDEVGFGAVNPNKDLRSPGPSDCRFFGVLLVFNSFTGILDNADLSGPSTDAMSLVVGLEAASAAAVAASIARRPPGPKEMRLLG